MDQEYAVETSLQELGKVGLRLRSLALKKEPPFLQVAGLIKGAQNELGLLETSMRDNPYLIQAQIGLLEAYLLLQRAEPGEAIRTACSNLHWFLESTGRQG